MARTPINTDIYIMIFMGMLFNAVGAYIQIGAFKNKSLLSTDANEAPKVQQLSQQSRQTQPSPEQSKPQEVSQNQPSQQTQSGSRQVSVQQ